MTITRRALMGATGLAVAAALSAPALSPALAQEVTWRATTIYPATSNSGPAFEAMKSALEEGTDGAMTMQLNPGGSLGFANEDNFEVVGDGVIEVAETLTGALVGVDPLFGAASLPFIIAEDAEAQPLMEAVTPTFEAIFEANDQILLGWGAFPAVGVFGKAPATSMDEFGGVKVRTYDAFSAEAMSDLGATPVQLPFSEVVTALSSGVVDAMLTSTEGGKVTSAWDLGITDFTALGYSTPITLLHASREAFDALTPEQQDAVRAAGEVFTRTHWESGRDSVAANIALLEENGITVHDTIDDAMRSQIEETRDRIAASWAEENGEDAAALLATVRGE